MPSDLDWHSPAFVNRSAILPIGLNIDYFTIVNQLKQQGIAGDDRCWN
jgi:hypothetical protein